MWWSHFSLMAKEAKEWYSTIHFQSAYFIDFFVVSRKSSKPTEQSIATAESISLDSISSFVILSLPLTFRRIVIPRSSWSFVRSHLVNWSLSELPIPLKNLLLWSDFHRLLSTLKLKSNSKEFWIFKNSLRRLRETSFGIDNWQQQHNLPTGLPRYSIQLHCLIRYHNRTS